MAGRSEIPQKMIIASVLIALAMIIIALISLRVIPAPTTAEILMWIIEFIIIAFMAVLGGVFFGMYLYHIIKYKEEPEPWEEVIYRIYRKIEELQDEIEEIKKRLKKEIEREKKRDFYPSMCLFTI